MSTPSPRCAPKAGMNLEISSFSSDPTCCARTPIETQERNKKMSALINNLADLPKFSTECDAVVSLLELQQIVALFRRTLLGLTDDNRTTSILRQVEAAVNHYNDSLKTTERSRNWIDSRVRLALDVVYAGRHVQDENKGLTAASLSASGHCHGR